jgi:hypothetical protein
MVIAVDRRMTTKVIIAFAMRSLFLALVLAAPAAAQAVSLEFTPDPVPPAVPVTLTGTNASAASIVLPSPCTWVRIHQGSQAGPVVGPNGGCITLPITVLSGGMFTQQWNQLDPNSAPVPPGSYWAETRVYDANFTAIQTNWFCFTILAPGAPALTAAGPAQRGQSTALQIAAPSAAGGFWFCALSLDSNNPVTVLGLPTCLSLPVTGDAFTNSFGMLDGQGRSAGLALNVPNLAFLQYRGLQVQAMLQGPAGLQLTNGLSFTVR